MTGLIRIGNSHGIRLYPTQRSEIRKTRPGVVISPDEMSSLRTTIIIPMTSKGFHYPPKITCTFQGRKGWILLDQIRAVDKTRLIRKLGGLSKKVQTSVLHCLQELFTK